MNHTTWRKQGRRWALLLGILLALGDYLTQAGSLDVPTEMRASFDVTGYQLMSGADEAPRFAPAAEASWIPVGGGVRGGWVHA